MDTILTPRTHPTPRREARAESRARPWLTAMALGGAALMYGCGAAERPESTVAQTVEHAPDSSWVAIHGTVAATEDDSFMLDYGPDQVRVEVDDWDTYHEARAMMEGDRVVVQGYVDADFYQARTIEAASVYVTDLGTQFYASGADEEDFPVVTRAATQPEVELTGTIAAVRPNEFVLDTGSALVDVNVSRLMYDPLDDEGFQRLDVGDRVRVRGPVGYDLFADLDLMADAVVSIAPSI